jgi:phosphate-selective porin OprO and OprP
LLSGHLKLAKERFARVDPGKRHMISRRAWPRFWACLVGLGCCWIASGLAVWSQSPLAATLAPPIETISPPQPDPAKPAAPSVDKLVEQVRTLEASNKALAEQFDRTRSAQDMQIRQLLDRFGPSNQQPPARQNGAPAPDTNAITANGSSATGTRSSPVPDYTEGMFAPFAAAPGYSTDDITGGSSRFPLKASFGPGFRLQTEEGDYSFTVHYESQIEGRLWGQNQVPANDGFFLPRQRFFFDGNITKTVEYELSINRGLGGINVLNAYLNFHFDDQFELRIGRFFTPLAYEQFAVSNYWLLTPERSVFTTNLNLNRQIGVMGWGYLLDERLDYAVGVFNGSRNSFESLNNSVDTVAFINARPFQDAEGLACLRFLNLGSSVAFGQQDQNPSPVTFRIAGGSPDTNIPGAATTPFLILNPDVIERGPRVVGSTHLAYFYRGFSLLSEWQYGFGGYASATQLSSVRVPYSGFYVAGGWFLTGEEIERRTRLKPLRPLIPLKGEPRGLGAWELTGRVAQLRISDNIFAAGFADPHLWSNSVVTTELGLNWYWNEYIKFYMFWLRGEFGTPVQFRPGGFQKSADMLWLRCQLYF